MMDKDETIELRNAILNNPKEAHKLIITDIIISTTIPTLEDEAEMAPINFLIEERLLQKQDITQKVIPFDVIKKARQDLMKKIKCEYKTIFREHLDKSLTEK